MYCGIDVSKNKSNVCILDNEKNVVNEFEIVHNKEGFEKLEQHLTKDIKIGMEVTGNYSKALYKYFSSRYQVFYIDSFQICNFAKINSPTIKNDKVDARLIALFLALGYKTINPVRIDELKDLYKLYQKTVNQSIKYKCMVKDQVNILFPEIEKYIGARANKSISHLIMKYPTPKDIAQIKVEDIYQILNENLKKKGRVPMEYAQKIKVLAENSIGDSEYPTTCFQYTVKISQFFQEQIKEIAENIERRLMKTPYYKLINEFGYNTISLAALISEVGDIRRFPNHKKFVSYCGLGISQKHSGSSVRKKSVMTKRGNSNLRHLLYILTLVHLRNKTQYANFFQRLKERGKHPRSALIATARKLAIKAYYDMMKCHN